MERTITIGFLGCGNVGGGVWKLLNGFADDIAHRTGLRFSIKRVLVRSLAKKRDIDFPEGVLTDRVEDVLDDPEISIATRIAFGYTSHNAAELSRNILAYYFGVEDEETLLNGQAEEVDSTSNAVSD